MKLIAKILVRTFCLLRYSITLFLVQALVLMPIQYEFAKMDSFAQQWITILPHVLLWLTMISLWKKRWPTFIYYGNEMHYA